MALDAMHSHLPTIPSYTKDFSSSCLMSPKVMLVGLASVIMINVVSAQVKEMSAKWIKWKKSNWLPGKV